MDFDAVHQDYYDRVPPHFALTTSTTPLYDDNVYPIYTSGHTRSDSAGTATFEYLPALVIQRDTRAIPILKPPSKSTSISQKLTGGSKRVGWVDGTASEATRARKGASSARHAPSNSSAASQSTLLPTLRISNGVVPEFIPRRPSVDLQPSHTLDPETSGDHHINGRVHTLSPRAKIFELHEQSHSAEEQKAASGPGTSPVLHRETSEADSADNTSRDGCTSHDSIENVASLLADLAKRLDSTETVTENDDKMNRSQSLQPCNNDRACSGVDSARLTEHRVKQIPSNQPLAKHPSAAQGTSPSSSKPASPPPSRVVQHQNIRSAGFQPTGFQPAVTSATVAHRGPANVQVALHNPNVPPLPPFWPRAHDTAFVGPQQASFPHTYGFGVYNWHSSNNAWSPHPPQYFPPRYTLPPPAHYHSSPLTIYPPAGPRLNEIPSSSTSAPRFSTTSPSEGSVDSGSSTDTEKPNLLDDDGPKPEDFNPTLALARFKPLQPSTPVSKVRRRTKTSNDDLMHVEDAGGEVHANLLSIQSGLDALQRVKDHKSGRMQTTEEDDGFLMEALEDLLSTTKGNTGDVDAGCLGEHLTDVQRLLLALPRKQKLACAFNEKVLRCKVAKAMELLATASGGDSES